MCGCRQRAGSAQELKGSLGNPTWLNPVRRRRLWSSRLPNSERTWKPAPAEGESIFGNGELLPLTSSGGASETNPSGGKSK